jgi:hypothetical protein
MKNKLIFILVFTTFICACKKSDEAKLIVKSLLIIQQFEDVSSRIDFDQRSELSWSIKRTKLVELSGYGQVGRIAYSDLALQKTTSFVQLTANTKDVVSKQPKKSYRRINVYNEV